MRFLDDTASILSDENLRFTQKTQKNTSYMILLYMIIQRGHIVALYAP